MDQLPFHQPGRFYRGNLHAHSNVSDGRLDPGELVRIYQENGYDFIAVTDHFRERFEYPITDTSNFRSESFTTLLGAELHAPCLGNGEDWHLLAVGLPPDFAPTEPHEDGPALAARARGAGAFISLAHPHWYSMTVDDAQSITAAHSVEIYNQTCAMSNDRGNGWYLADLLLSQGRRVTAIATDDTHARKERPDMFGGWVMVRSESNQPADLRAALKAGHFYSSQGPLFHDIQISPDRSQVSIRCSPVSSVQISGLAQKSYDLHGHGLTHAEFSLDKFTGAHFRVTVIDDRGRRAWSNPVWLE